MRAEVQKELEQPSSRQHIRRLFIIAYPVMLSHLGHIAVGVADSMMVGQLGALPLAAVSLANSIFVLALMFGIGISIGLTPLVAAADGQGQVGRITRLLKHSLLINIISGLLLFLLLMAVIPFLYALDQPAAVVELATPYLWVVGASLLPFMLFQGYKQLIEGLGHTRQAMVITLLANGVNVGLNYLLIFGKLGFPEMGLVGAGWATLFSRVFMAAMMAAYFYRSRLFAAYRNATKGFKKKIIRKLLSLGVPMGFQYVFEVGAFSGAAIMVGWIGAKALAAHQIALNLASVSYMIASGFAAAATVRVGNQLGQKNYASMQQAGFISFGIGLLIMLFFALSFIAGQHFFPSLYIDDEEVIEIAATLLVIAAFFQLSDGVQVVGLGTLRALEDVKVPTLITLIAYWVIGLPGGYLLAFHAGLGVQGIWWGLLCGLTVAAVFLSWRFWRLSNRYQR
ncbi:MATE family efflux transporter [Nafulsella turpanensis]|uniref:MATE family efflux transporter n=1 Tax=Nafulsella turpanensis TaxID=1265690 RepID=UPI00034A6629|nr:MATE family efflux transporter [Nafulsella turpanensis]